jgi:hypothetical protein
MTKFQDLFVALARPFGSDEVRVLGKGGKACHYVTARAVMNRLDDVLGPENWWDEYVPLENSVVCRLSIRLPDGSVLTKSDAGGYAGMADSGDDDKSGFSDAFKRASVKIGVGRHLYGDGLPQFVHDALEAAAPHDEPPATNGASRNGSAPGRNGRDGEWQGGYKPPRGRGGAPVQEGPGTGRDLFTWAKEHDRANGTHVLEFLGAWGKRQGCPGRVVDWTPDQARAGHAAATRRLQETRE